MSTISEIVTDAKSEKARKAKKTLVNFVDVINKKLDNYFDSELKSPFGVSIVEKKLTKHILEHIKEHNLRPAKRLRASLSYYGYKLFDTPGKAAYDAAMCVEIVHTALLMHDDFMDEDNTRRGLPTTHEYYKAYHKTNKFRFDAKHYGESMAVNVGDIALCLGYELLSNTNAPSDRVVKATTRILRGIANTAYGQSFDVTLESGGIVNESDIINLHHAKTAIYTYENPLHVGAILAGASRKSDLNILSEYAIPGGVAFQLQDDILGLFGNPKKTGKPAHSDLRQGKMTLLIINALEKANKEEKKQLLKYWGDRSVTDKEANVVRKIVIDTGSLDYSRKISVKYAKRAQLAVPKMIKKGWNKEAIDYLDGIAQYMVEREV